MRIIKFLINIHYIKKINNNIFNSLFYNIKIKIENFLKKRKKMESI